MTGGRVAIGWAAAGAVPSRPALVARPTDTAQVSAVLRLCDDARVPVTPAGGRSGVCGASIPLFGGVALDLCGLDGIADVDDTSLVADLRAGTFGPDVESGLRDGHGLTLGHWPQSMDLSTVGGWLACRGAGQYSNRYGKIEDMVLGLEVVLADGRIVHTGGTARARPPGPTSPSCSWAARAPSASSPRAGSACTRCPGARVAGPSGSPRSPTASTPAGASSAAAPPLPSSASTTPPSRAATSTSPTPTCWSCWTRPIRPWSTPPWPWSTPSARAPPCWTIGLVDRWLTHRNDVSALAPLWRAGVVVDTVEVAGRWAALPGLYDAVVGALGRVPGTLAASLAPEPRLHRRRLPVLHLRRPTPRRAARGRGRRDAWVADYYRRAWDEVSQATMDAGGALSHHHGIGINRGRFLGDALGGAFEVLASVKAALDPHGILNPGKLGLPTHYGEVPWP